MRQAIVATIQEEVVLGFGGTTKHKGKRVKTIEFFLERKGKKVCGQSKDGDILVTKVNGERWMGSFDSHSLLCEMGLKIKIF